MTTTFAPQVQSVGEAPDAVGRYRFGPFEIDLGAELVTRDGTRLALPPQPFRLLRTLLHSGGRVVTREELKQTLWGDDTFVDFDRGLNFCILQLRNALADDARQPEYIETVPRKGYRFIAAVTPAGAREVALVQPRIKPVPAVMIVVAALIAAAAAWWTTAPRRLGSPAGRIRLAVLPIENISGPGDAGLVDGLTEETITELSQVAPDRLAVVARTSVEQFRGSRKDIRAVAETLGVDYVLEGSVRRQDDRIRATFQLIRAADQTHVWSETYDREAADILALQSALARRVASSLELTLVARRAMKINPRAFDEYLLGRTLTSRRDTADLEAGVNHLQQAVALEPRFASAHTALAEAWQLLQMRGRLSPAEAGLKIRAAVDAALTADPDLASAHAAAGMLLFYYDWDFDGAERELQRALRMNPSDGVAHHDYGWLLIARGRPDAAIEQIRLGQELDPLSPRANIDVAWAYIYSGRYDQAIGEARRMLGTDPEFEETHSCLQHAYEMKGNFDAAILEVRRRMENSGKTAEWGELASLTPKEALRSIHERRLVSLKNSAGPTDPYRMAQESAMVGRSDEAFQFLEASLQTRSPSLPLAAADPMLASLRPDPRFQLLMRRVGGR